MIYPTMSYLRSHTYNQTYLGNDICKYENEVVPLEYAMKVSQLKHCSSYSSGSYKHKICIPFQLVDLLTIK
jgi:hypothetical protein